MGLNLDRYRKKKETTTSSGFGAGDFWLPQPGKNIFRIFTFQHTIEEDDFELGRYSRMGGVEIGEEHTEIDAETYIHFVGNKPHVCSREDDCEFCSDAKKEKKLAARLRYYVNVIPLMTGGKKVDEMKIHIASLTKTVYNDVLGYLLDEDYGEGIIGENGRDFIIEYDPDAQGSDMYSTRLRDANKSQEIDMDDVGGEITDLYNFDQIKPEAFRKGKPAGGEVESEPKKGKKAGKTSDKSSSTRPARAGKKVEKKEPKYEIGDLLAFDDKKLGTISGKLTGIEEADGKDVYIIEIEDGREFEAYLDEIYVPETKKSKRVSRRG